MLHNFQIQQFERYFADQIGKFSAYTVKYKPSVITTDFRRSFLLSFYYFKKMDERAPNNMNEPIDMLYTQCPKVPKVYGDFGVGHFVLTAGKLYNQATNNNTP